MNEKIKENIMVVLMLSILPLYMLSGMFMVSAINCWELWRAFVGFSFLVIAGINFSLILVFGN